MGGGGGNAVNRMIESSTGVLGVELWTVNTDAQALSRSLAPKKLNIGALTSRLESPFLLFCDDLFLTNCLFAWVVF